MADDGILYIQFDPSAAISALKHIEGGCKAAVANAVKKGLETAKSQARIFAKTRYLIPKDVLDAAMTRKAKVEGAFASTIQGTVVFKGPHIDLNIVQHKDDRPEGVIFRLMRGAGGRGRASGEVTRMAHAFVPSLKTWQGRNGVPALERVGDERYPLKHPAGPATPWMLLNNLSRPIISEAASQRMEKALENNVKALIKGASKVSKTGAMYSVRNPLSRRARELVLAGRMLESDAIGDVTGD
jgi:hypothetical protein